MEFVLKNINIFDESVYDAFDKLLKANIKKFPKKFPYIIFVSFNLGLEYSVESQPLIENLIDSSNTINAYDDINSKALSIQADKFKEILNANEIETFSLTIQGENLDINNSVKIRFKEDKSKPLDKIKAKNEITIVAISHNIHKTTENVSKLKHERMSKIFDDYINIIRDRKIMSEILDISPTDNINELYMSFVEQYGDLWLTTNQREKELLDRLKEKSLSVIDKYFKTNIFEE